MWWNVVANANLFLATSKYRHAAFHLWIRPWNINTTLNRFSYTNVIFLFLTYAVLHHTVKLDYYTTKLSGLVRDLNPGPRAPEARIIPLDQRAGARKLMLRINTISANVHTTEILDSAISILHQTFSKLPYRFDMVCMTCISYAHIHICIYSFNSIHIYNTPHSDTKAVRARPGFEPGTSRTQSENHTPRPTSHRWWSHALISVWLCTELLT